MHYRIIEGYGAIDIDSVVRLLKTTYWANHRTRAQIEKSMHHSDCYGVVTDDNRLVGFARVITDYATTYYLCDVVIDPECRGQGLGTALVEHIETAPVYDGLRGMLITRDAHALYEKFGYQVLNGRAMVKALNC